MAFTDINSEDRLVQKTFADHLEKALGWESIYAWNDEKFGPDGTLGRTDTRDVVLTRYLRAALERLNPKLPPAAIAEAVQKMTRHDFSRSLMQKRKRAPGAFTCTSGSKVPPASSPLLNLHRRTPRLLPPD